MRFRKLYLRSVIPEKTNDMTIQLAKILPSLMDYKLFICHKCSTPQIKSIDFKSKCYHGELVAPLNCPRTLNMMSVIKHNPHVSLVRYHNHLARCLGNHILKISLLTAILANVKIRRNSKNIQR